MDKGIANLFIELSTLADIKIRNSFYCVDCQKDTWHGHDDYYMVTDALWECHGVGKAMLCIGCLETRIDSKLCKQDLTDVPINWNNPYTRKLLSS